MVSRDGPGQHRVHRLGEGGPLLLLLIQQPKALFCDVVILSGAAGGGLLLVGLDRPLLLQGVENGVEGALLHGEGVVALGLQLGDHLVAVLVLSGQEREYQQGGAARQQGFIRFHGKPPFRSKTIPRVSRYIIPRNPRYVNRGFISYGCGGAGQTKSGPDCPKTGPGADPG